MKKLKNILMAIVYIALCGFVFDARAQITCNVLPEKNSTTNVTGAFRIIATQVPSNVTRMTFPTWGASGGQDDLVWYQGVSLGNGTWYVDIDLARHKQNAPELGRFDTHVYATTDIGAEYLCGATTWNRELDSTPSCNSAAPSLSSTTELQGLLRIYAYGVVGAQSMTFPTWGDSGGQDDLVWYPGVNQGNGVWYADVDLSRHKPGNPEYGNFQTHVYVKNSNGVERLCAAVNWKREAQAAPSCSAVMPSSSVTLATSGNFRVYAQGVKNANSVKFPTWGSDGGQNDIVWYQGIYAGGETWYADVNLANHGAGKPEYGEFITHAHVTSSTGSTAICGAKWHRPQIIVFNASANTQADGWRDTRILPDGQLAMVPEIRSAFCNPKCPEGNARIGIAYTADLMDGYDSLSEQHVLDELNALVRSAKLNNFYFAIHANHEWVFKPSANPFGVPTQSWAEHTNWGEPLQRYWVGWGSPLPEIGLKPNFESIAVRTKVEKDIALISNFIKNNILADAEAKKLFLGVDFGWETDVGVAERPDNTALKIGYAALSNRKNPKNGNYFGPGNEPDDFESELGNVARDFVKFGVEKYLKHGIPRDYLFTHLVASAYDDTVRIKRTPLDAASAFGINLGVSSFGSSFALNRINNARTGAPWFIMETDPETALGAAVTNVDLPQPGIISIYSWADTMRPNLNNLTNRFNNLFGR